MVSNLGGQWPWESGRMPETASGMSAAPVAPSPPFYTLPTVRDRRAEGGRRPASVRELIELRRARLTGRNGPFRW